MAEAVAEPPPKTPERDPKPEKERESLYWMLASAMPGKQLCELVWVATNGRESVVTLPTHGFKQAPFTLAHALAQEER